MSEPKILEKKIEKDKVVYIKLDKEDEGIVEMYYDYDKKGNLIHFKDSQGHEFWSEYDKNGRETKYKTNYYEIKQFYDDLGRVIKRIDSNGHKIIYRYNDNGFMELWFNSSLGISVKYIYDEQNQIIECLLGKDGYEYTPIHEETTLSALISIANSKSRGRIHTLKI